MHFIFGSVDLAVLQTQKRRQGFPFLKKLKNKKFYFCVMSLRRAEYAAPRGWSS